MATTTMRSRDKIPAWIRIKTTVGCNRLLSTPVYHANSLLCAFLIVSYIGRRPTEQASFHVYPNGHSPSVRGPTTPHSPAPCCRTRCVAPPRRQSPHLRQSSRARRGPPQAATAHGATEMRPGVRPRPSTVSSSRSSSDVRYSARMPGVITPALEQRSGPRSAAGAAQPTYVRSSGATQWPAHARSTRVVNAAPLGGALGHCDGRRRRTPRSACQRGAQHRDGCPPVAPHDTGGEGRRRAVR